MTASRACIGAALLTSLIVSMTGCGAPASTPTASSPAQTSVPPPTPTASEMVAAVSHTRGLGTAAIEVTVETSVGGTSRSYTGTGAAALDQGYGNILWTNSDGTRTREISNGRGLFVQLDAPDGRWTRLDEANGTPTGPLADPLRGLGGLQGVIADGRETLGEVEATRYTGSLPATAEALGRMGLSEEDRADVDGSGTRIDVAVWVDDAGRVIRVDRALDEGSARTSTTLSRFSDPVDLSPPPTESVDEAPDSQ